MPIRPGRHKPRQPTTQRVHVIASRATSSQRGYTYKWQKQSKAFLLLHPCCVMCADEGRVVAATDVDHIIPHRGDMRLFWDQSNWQPLCHAHHSAKTAREDGGFGNAPRGR
jgi:5-methylcytosine-specific restriction protein A